MPSHVVFFLLALSFLSGILFAGLGLTLLFSLIPATILFAALFSTNTNVRIAILSAILLVIGCAYYQWDDSHYQAAIAQLPPTIEIQGTITDIPKHGPDYQSFPVKTMSGTLQVIATPLQQYSYGEVVEVKGKVEPPTATYFSRHVVGLLKNPSITHIGFAGNPILRYVYKVRTNIELSYEKMLSPDRAAFLFGIIFGVNDNISPQFASDLQLSGLRFITAIDGLHMQIVIMIICMALLSVLPRKYALLLTYILVFMFIALTGFTTSGIRASLMAGISLFARESRRMYMAHNALAFTAIVLALINPKVLVFDVGFQLSFLAVISIIYAMPVLRQLLRLSADPGFLAWKESLLITISVQLATAPLIISQFQTFSLTSFIASVLAVWMLPFILTLGLLIALFSFFIYPLALVLSFVVAPLLDYVALVVRLFARLAVVFNPPLGFPGTVAYYAAMVGFLFWYYREPLQAEKPAPVAIALPKTELSKLADEFEIVEI